MKKKIFRNWGLKLSSLLLAFILWFLAAQINNPKDTVTFSGIQVRLTNTELLDQEDKVYEIMENSDVVRVTIRAPKSVTRDLRASDIVAVADVSKLTDINTIAISYSIQGLPSTSYDTIKGDHDVVRLNVEDRASKWIRVQNQTVGEVADGYVVMSSSADQTQIQVTGPASAVAKIYMARVEVDVNGVSASMSLNVEPKLYDADGNLLEFSSVSTNVSHIHMAVEVLAVKEVPVVPNSMGIPAEGYLATGEVLCEPATVKIAGTAAAIAGVNSIIIPEEQLDITGAAGNVVNTVNIKDYLKNDIKLADSGFSGRVTVTAYVEPIVDKTFALGRDDFDLTGVPEGYEIELIEPQEGYKLTVSGLDAAVSAVPEETVRGKVDIGAWLAEEGIEEPEDGIYEIPASFVLPDDVDMKEKMTVSVSFVKWEDI